MYYQVKHTTTYRYDNIISESVMEVRKQPRTEGSQRCLSFMLDIEPAARVSVHRDYLGNFVHFFNMPIKHRYLEIAAEAVVQVDPMLDLPDALPAAAWDELDGLRDNPEFYDYLRPSKLTNSPTLMKELRAELGLKRMDDPLTQVHQLTHTIYDLFAYVPNATSVDSPVDDVIIGRQGVCQDFAHVMLALCRWLGIPARYVSGYLYRQKEEPDHVRSVPDASHAWIEAYLPGLGWRGFDPTNDLICLNQHIRVGVGRDYVDVPPTHGVFKGNASSVLEVAVSVKKLDQPPEDEDLVAAANWPVRSAYITQQQQQQQQ